MPRADSNSKTGAKGNPIPAGRPHFPALTGIRIFLALWVISYHLTSSTGILPLSERLPWPASNLVYTAYAAVETFFILSGFILSALYPCQQWWTKAKLYGFASARFARIYPVYALSLALSVPFALPPLLRDPSWRQIVTQSGIGLTHWSLLQAWIPGIALEWNSPAWSLSAEVSFYLVFPFLSVLVWRHLTIGRLAVVSLAFWSMAIAVPLVFALNSNFPFYGMTAVSPHGPEGTLANLVKFNPILRVADFCLGVVAGRMFSIFREKYPRMAGRGYWFYLPGMFLFVTTASLGNSIPFLLFNNGLTAPFLTMIVFGLALGGGTVERILASPLAMWGGELSYAVYLLQDPVLSYCRFAAKHAGFAVSGYILAAVFLITLFGLAVAAVQFVEKPMNRMLRARFDRNRAVAASRQPVRAEATLGAA